jgi:hypothetical protein
VVAINELSIALQNEMNNTNLTGVTLGPGCAPIHSLLFAEDIICGKAKAQEATTINTILQHSALDRCPISKKRQSYLA